MQTTNFKELSDSEIQQKIIDSPLKFKDNFVFFSTEFGGFTRNPRWLHVPIDDHGFHRGDGVFEAIKAVRGKLFLLQPHIDRLWRSAAMIDLNPPLSKEQLSAIVEQGVRMCETPETIIRIYCTRGPGGFGVSPTESLGSQLYVVIMKRKDLPAEKYGSGVSVGISKVPWKPGFFSQVKSLNYLPNVLMKHEGNKRGFDFMVGVDDEGFLTEGPTENLVVLSKDGKLLHPRLSKMLKGCTMTRLFDLVEEARLLPVSREAKLHIEDLKSAQEIFMVGTTLDVLPVARVEETAKPLGPWAKKLLEVLLKDQA